MMTSRATVERYRQPMPFAVVRRQALGLISALILVMLLSWVILGQIIAPRDPNVQSLRDRLLPPVWHVGGSWSHPLGTDQLGRDLLSRLIIGARTTLGIALVAALLEAMIGITLGLIAGYRGGRVESAIMRWTDIQMAFPSILLLMMIILVFGRSKVTLVVAIAINGWMIFARFTRARVQVLKTQGFVEAAVVAGAKPYFIVWQHIIPHIRVDALALLILEIARIILAESVISFVGIGVQPPDISWGLMIGGSRTYIPVAYHLALFPGLMITTTVVALTYFSTWIAPIIDPVRRRV